MQVSPHGAPHEAVNRLHESTYMIKYEEAIKYVIKDAVDIFCPDKTCCWHLLPRRGGIFDGGMIILIQHPSLPHVKLV